MPDRGQAQQGLRHITGNDPERDQLTEGQIATEHHGGTDPEHHQLRNLLQHLAGLIQGRTCDRFLKGSGDVLGIEPLPAPAADHLHVLSLHRLDAGKHLHQVALGLGVFFGSSTELTAEEGSPQHCQTDLDRKNG